MTSAAVYIKAILATLVAGLGALGTALSQGGVTAPEWVAVASSAAVAASLVYAVPNTAGAVTGALGVDL